MYPAFVSCTTIDWFSEWPNDALLEVAEKYLEEVNLDQPNPSAMAKTENGKQESGKQDAQKQSTSIRQNVASVFVVCHRSVVEMSARMLFEMRRHNYVTPTNYLELVSGYKKYVHS